jgi:hypothetical protein
MGISMLICKKCGKEICGYAYYCLGDGPYCSGCYQPQPSMVLNMPKADGKCCVHCPKFFSVCYPVGIIEVVKDEAKEQDK